MTQLHPGQTKCTHATEPHSFVSSCRAFRRNGSRKRRHRCACAPAVPAPVEALRRRHRQRRRCCCRISGIGKASAWSLPRRCCHLAEPSVICQDPWQHHNSGQESVLRPRPTQGHGVERRQSLRKRLTFRVMSSTNSISSSRFPSDKIMSATIYLARANPSSDADATGQSIVIRIERIQPNLG